MTVQLRNMTDISGSSLQVSVLMEYTPQEIQEGRWLCKEWSDAMHAEKHENDALCCPRMMMVPDAKDGARDQERLSVNRSLAEGHRIESHDDVKILIPLCKQQEVKLALAKDRGRRANTANE
ncbi:hypothetical protein CBR_g8782 [Chara braunii]|uniref:Uncharacterized protein n=1 Tax=Chara braunii TaxID=69332 RepID=A0A388KN45_CHABU|nr:hypothetical protein CBR_g8782 [Chara braunii]|eukprot:GBG71363.1 hypothetical protein CBR_g8782 [Chara braunii]